MTQQGYFSLKGLNRGGGDRAFTCRTHPNEAIFWASCDWPRDRFLALFDLAKNTDDFWKTNWLAYIEYDGIYSDGTPRHPKVLHVVEEANANL